MGEHKLPRKQQTVNPTPIQINANRVQIMPLDDSVAMLIIGNEVAEAGAPLSKEQLDAMGRQMLGIASQMGGGIVVPQPSLIKP